MFPLLAALLLVLVTFAYHDGVLRPLALVLQLLGFLLWYKIFHPIVTPVFHWIRFWLCVGVRYLLAILLLPPRFLWRVLSLVLLRPLALVFRALLHRFWRRRTEMLCKRELVLAGQGFGILTKCLIKKEKGNEKGKKKI